MREEAIWGDREGRSSIKGVHISVCQIMQVEQKAADGEYGEHLQTIARIISGSFWCVKRCFNALSGCSCLQTSQLDAGAQNGEECRLPAWLPARRAYRRHTADCGVEEGGGG